eukprot:COSAG02_NODE_13753_length_1353_cov_27.219697_2_plen_40_part_01
MTPGGAAGTHTRTRKLTVTSAESFAHGEGVPGAEPRAYLF